MQDQWYRRAQLALDKGEEELARDALRRKKSFSDNAAMLKKQLDQHTRASGQLMTNIRSVSCMESDCHSLVVCPVTWALIGISAQDMAVCSHTMCLNSEALDQSYKWLPVLPALRASHRLVLCPPSISGLRRPLCMRKMTAPVANNQHHGGICLPLAYNSRHRLRNCNTCPVQHSPQSQTTCCLVVLLAMHHIACPHLASVSTRIWFQTG